MSNKNDSAQLQSRMHSNVAVCLHLLLKMMSCQDDVSSLNFFRIVFFTKQPQAFHIKPADIVPSLGSGSGSGGWHLHRGLIFQFFVSTHKKKTPI